jgi:hypothetical protein
MPEHQRYKQFKKIQHAIHVYRQSQSEVSVCSQLDLVRGNMPVATYPDNST